MRLHGMIAAAAVSWGLMVGQAAATAAGEPTAGSSTAVAPPGAAALSPALLAENAAKPVPPIIPTAAFAAMPVLSDPVLSPDGRAIAARSDQGGREALMIVDVAGKALPRRIVFTTKDDLLDYVWAGNGRVLYSIARGGASRDDDAVASNLVAVDVATGQQHRVGGKQRGFASDDVLWVDPQGQSVLLAYQGRADRSPAVFSVDLATNRATLVVKPVANIWAWHADVAGTVRYGYGWRDMHHWQMVYRTDPSQKFSVVVRGTDKNDLAADDAEDKALRLAAGSDETFVYATDPATGLKGIYRYNFASHKRGPLVFEAPGSDVDDIDLSQDGKTISAIKYVDSRDRIKWLDPRMSVIQSDLDRRVEAALGDRQASIVSRSRDDAVMLVSVVGANDPGQYYVYEQATGRLSRFAQLNPRLAPADLAPTHYTFYTARDGTVIPAYVTLPVGRAARGLPLIVMPHGGPYWVRDHGDFDGDVQFLANRGYVVLQPQFRGSGSYGKAFDEKGEAQWGRAMQDDLDDGMDWLVKQGIADPGRTCIVGSSYGGYAAMWGATRNPERYRCAVSFAGISDLARQIRYTNEADDEKASREQWRQRVQGDPHFDLRTLSPLDNVDRLAVPILLVHGAKDQTVPPQQSRLYAAALKAAGRTYEYVELPGEGHGLFTETAAQAWYDRLDAFLARYNPAG